MSLIVAEYECPYHGRFEVTLERDENGDPPAEQPCPDYDYIDGPEGPEDGAMCRCPSPWVISAPIGSVKVGEVQRGRVAKPDSPMYLDTRELGEGMSMSEFRAKRRKLYEERRHKESKTW